MSKRVVFDGEFALCSSCSSDAEREDCERCGGDGVDGHDCGEDSCPCLHPEENLPCGDCDGHGAHWMCTGSCGYINPPEEAP